MRARRRPARPASLLAALALAAGCSAPAPAPVPPQRVENDQLGVTLAALPDAFEVVANEGDRLELLPSGEGVSGSVTFAVDDSDPSLNLVAARQAHKDAILARPGGEYKGQRELGSQLGAAFYSRGRYLAEDGSTTEESMVIAIHPAGDRFLMLVYRYPAGEDSGARLESLFALLGQVEPPTTPEPTV